MRTLALVPLLLLAACTAVRPLTQPDATRSGRAAADRDLAAGEARILVIGRLGPEAPRVDEATGLPLQSADCAYSEENAAHVDAYNQRVRAAAVNDARLLQK